MTIKTLCVYGLATMYLAACSGGSTASTPGSSVPAGAVTTARTGSVSVAADVAKLQSAQRVPQFIGAGVTNVAYQFYTTAGSVSGEPNGTEPLACNNSNGSGTNCTITIAGVPQGSYGGLSLALTTAAPAVLGSGFAVQTSDSGNATTGDDSWTPTTQSGTPLITTLTSGAAKYAFSVAAATATDLDVVFAPVNSAPALSFTPSYATSPAGVFFVDGTATTQSVSVAANERDPAGNVITTANGPVANYPVLTPTAPDAFGFSPASVSTAPATASGTAVAVEYKGTTTPSSANETVTLSDGVAMTTTSIPFVALSAAAGGTGGYAAPDVYVNNGQTVTLTITERNAYDVGSTGTPNADALTATTTCAAGVFAVADDEATPQSVGSGSTLTPFDGNAGNTGSTGGGSAPTALSPNGQVAYTVTAPAPAGSCTLTIASSLHSALALTFTIAPNTGNVGITGSAYKRK